MAIKNKPFEQINFVRISTSTKTLAEARTAVIGALNTNTSLNSSKYWFASLAFDDGENPVSIDYIWSNEVVIDYGLPNNISIALSPDMLGNINDNAPSGIDSFPNASHNVYEVDIDSPVTMGQLVSLNDTTGKLMPVNFNKPTITNIDVVRDSITYNFYAGTLIPGSVDWSMSAIPATNNPSVTLYKSILHESTTTSDRIAGSLSISHPTLSSISVMSVRVYEEHQKVVVTAKAYDNPIWKFVVLTYDYILDTDAKTITFTYNTSLDTVITATLSTHPMDIKDPINTTTKGHLIKFSVGSNKLSNHYIVGYTINNSGVVELFPETFVGNLWISTFVWIDGQGIGIWKSSTTSSSNTRTKLFNIDLDNKIMDIQSETISTSVSNDIFGYSDATHYKSMVDYGSKTFMVDYVNAVGHVYVFDYDSVTGTLAIDLVLIDNTYGFLWAIGAMDDGAIVVLAGDASQGAVQYNVIDNGDGSYTASEVDLNNFIPSASAGEFISLTGTGTDDWTLLRNDRNTRIVYVKSLSNAMAASGYKPNTPIGFVDYSAGPGELVHVTGSGQVSESIFELTPGTKYYVSKETGKLTHVIAGEIYYIGEAIATNKLFIKSIPIV